MNRYLCLADLVCVVVVSLFTNLKLTEAQLEDFQPLSIQIIPSKVESGQNIVRQDGNINIRICNHSEVPIELLTKWNALAGNALSFQITDHGGNKSVHISLRKPTEYAEHDESDNITIVHADGYREWTLSSSPNNWRSLPPPNTRHSYSIVARLNIAQPLPNGGRLKTWAGKIESPAITVRFVDDEIQSPAEYLTHFPKQAIHLLENDSKWQQMTKPELELLLVEACRCRAPDVVKWLLTRGISADARVPDEEAINTTSPIATVIDPISLKLLIEHGVDLQSADGRSVLRRVTDLHAASHSDEWKADAWHESNWKEMANMLIREGVEYDIFSAIILDDFHHVQKLVEQKPQLISELGPDAHSPLRLAASLGRFEMCKFLIEAGADVNELSTPIRDPIVVDALEYPNIVELLIESGANTKRWTRYRGQSGFRLDAMGISIRNAEPPLLHDAILYGKPETLRILMDLGLDQFEGVHPPLKDNQQFETEDFCNSLFLATYLDRADHVSELLGHSSFDKVDEKTRKRVLDSAFEIARSVDIIEQLLKKGVNPNKPLRNGWKKIVQVGGDIEAVRVLRRFGATNSMHVAVATGNLDDVRKYLRADKSNSRTRYPNGCPVLFAAITNNHIDVVKELLTHDPGLAVVPKLAVEETHRYPVHYAVFCGRLRMTTMLLRNGADPNVRNTRGWSPLHDAVVLDNVDLVEELLNAGANPNLPDTQGVAPVDLAKKYGSSQLIDIIDRHNK